MRRFISVILSQLLLSATLLPGIVVAQIEPTPPTANLWMSPSKVEVNVGEEFEIILIASSINASINELNATIDYPGQLVRGTGYKDEGTAFPTIINGTPNVKNQNKQANFHVKSETPQNDFSMRVRTVVFKAQNIAGVANITVNAETTMIDADTGDNIYNSNDQNAQVTITDPNSNDESDSDDTPPIDNAQCSALSDQVDTIITRIFDRTTGQLETIEIVDTEVQAFGSAQVPPVSGYQDNVDMVDADNQAANSALLNLATAGINCTNDDTESEVTALVVAIYDIYNAVLNYRNSVFSMIELLEEGLSNG